MGWLGVGRHITAGGAGVENFMRVVSAMPDDL